MVARDAGPCANSPQNLACVLHGQPLTRVSMTREMIGREPKQASIRYGLAHACTPRFTAAVVAGSNRERGDTPFAGSGFPQIPPSNSMNWSTSL